MKGEGVASLTSAFRCSRCAGQIRGVGVYRMKSGNEFIKMADNLIGAQLVRRLVVQSEINRNTR